MLPYHCNGDLEGWSMLVVNAIKIGDMFTVYPPDETL